MRRRRADLAKTKSLYQHIVGGDLMNMRRNAMDSAMNGIKLNL